MSVDYIDPERVSDDRPPTYKQMATFVSLINHGELPSRRWMTQRINNLEAAMLIARAEIPEVDEFD